MSILGNRVLRKEDPKFLTAGGTYVDDLPLPGAVHITYVRSTMAHARVNAIEVSEASGLPGVVAIFTAADLDLEPVPPSGMFNKEMTRTLLASDTVRFVGEPVAVVVTEEQAQGADAAELVFVDYDPLDAVIDPDEAVASGTHLFPGAGTNVAFQMPGADDDDYFADCDVVVRQRIVNQRVAPCPLEVRAGAARWGEDGRLTQWASTQAAHGVRDDLAVRLGVEPSQVRIITPDVGGGFGAKIGIYPEEVLLGWVARRVGRPVRWVETRSESMTALGHGRGQVQLVELGGTRDGDLLAYRLNVVQDAGAYPGMGGMLPFMTRTMLTGVYKIPKAAFSVRTVVTNTTPTVAYRGAGRPEAAAAMERAVDIFADEAGLDPADVRRRNFISPAEFPYTTAIGTEYDSGDYEGALDRALDAAGYAELRAEQARRREAGDRRQLGIGISAYVEITGGIGGAEFGAVTINGDGSVTVRTGVSPHGQGHATAFAMLVADRLGIPMEQIELVWGDTDVVPFGLGTMGSRSLQSGGVAVNMAADEVLAQAKEQAADLLEASTDDIVLDRDGGRFHVAGTPTVARTWADLAAAAATSARGPLQAEASFNRPGPTFPFGAHVCVVEVDVETGRTEVLRMVACDDAGTILNPLLVDGQVHGGLAQGVAQALLEEVRYDPDGNPVTANLADYAFISATELPSFERVPMETPTPVNDLGAKGIGESGTIGSTPAVQNAVVDAVAHLGVRHIDMPCTPERVWHALQPANSRR
jgi:carbon-monoxide dehydrogenase large subunit